jgi:ABC-type transport system involved in cytochrome bd biosynthesis fused ATPase/permease subunit
MIAILKKHIDPKETSFVLLVMLFYVDFAMGLISLLALFLVIPLLMELVERIRSKLS